jgi:3-deoxy-manno-octulosonate cytidylyltransferase (CMP-KDO synthetase)|tara:strand:+ start:683 stop:1435 length:753 start_codon:yes stop_codon:yes gene_type:complete
MINSGREWDWMNRDERKVIAIIPARWASTRLPGKPLADINGKTMIQWVYEAVKKSNADKVIVATDHIDIFNEVEKFGGEAVMTNSNHQTGTERVLEAYKQYKDDYYYVINVQGDEPIINETDINRIIVQLKTEPTMIATMVGALTKSQATDRNTVKAIIDNGNIAMFSRSPVFYSSVNIKRHIGIYGFSKPMTERIDKNVMIETSNEIVENLEQIRWGDNNIGFTYIYAAGLYKGIDTQKDLNKVRTYLN